MNQLRELRINKGLSQEGLATISGVSLRTIQRIERDEALPRPQTLQTLAKALEVEEELLNTSHNEATYNGKAPLQKLALVNGIAYLIFPLVGAIISWINSNHQENNEVKKYLSSLFGIDILAFSLNMVIWVMFKLNGWSGGLEIAIVFHIILFLIVLGAGFILINSANRKT